MPSIIILNDKIINVFPLMLSMKGTDSNLTGCFYTMYSSNISHCSNMRIGNKEHTDKKKTH